MPLPLTVDSLDTVPEAARGAYVEKNGKFTLDAEIEDVSGLKAKNTELISKNKTLSERAKVIGDRTAEEIQADLDYAAEQRKLDAEKKGRYDDVVKQMADQKAKEVAAANAGTVAAEAKLFDVLAKREADREIEALGIKAKVLEPHVLPYLKVVKNDGEYETIVVDKKGNPRIDPSTGSPMTIKQLVAEVAADPDFDGVVPASGANGSGARNDGTAGRNTGVVIIPKDASPQEYRRLKADAEKRGVSYRVAS